MGIKSAFGKLFEPLAEFGKLVLFRQLREHESGRSKKFEPRLEDDIFWR